MDLQPETEPRLEVVVKPVRSNRRRIIVATLLLLLLLLAAVLTLLFVEGGGEHQVAILPETYWKHPTRFQKAASKVRRYFSLAPNVMIFAEVSKTKKLASFEAAAEMLGRAPFVETNGIAAWVLNAEDLTKLEKGIVGWQPGERLAAPKITTVESMEGSMFAGNSVPIDGKQVDVGLSMKVLPERVGKASTRLVYSFKLTEIKESRLQTNAAFVLRATVPDRGKILVLQERAGEELPMCLLVTVVNLPKK